MPEAVTEDVGQALEEGATVRDTLLQPDAVLQPEAVTDGEGEPLAVPHALGLPVWQGEALEESVPDALAAKLKEAEGETVLLSVAEPLKEGVPDGQWLAVPQGEAVAE